MAEGLKFKGKAMPVEVVLIGDSVSAGISKMVERANIERRPVWQRINGVFVVAEPGSDPDKLYELWEFSIENGGVPKLVTPHMEISRPTILYDIVNIQEKISELRSRLHKLESKKQALTCEYELMSAPKEVEFANEEGKQCWKELYEANKDDHLATQTLKSAENCMRLMQKWMDQGLSLTYDMAEEALRITDSVGHSGTSFSWTLTHVSKVWKHGAELKRLYEEVMEKMQK